MAKQPTSDWLRMKDVLDEALDLAPEERRAFVERRCADTGLKRQVLSMIYAFESGVATVSDDELDTETLDREPEPVIEEELYGPGSKVGAYRLEKSIGAGGMGTVFLAAREGSDFDQQVAIKLLKRRWASADEVSRFRRERQILADLQHPSIAQLLDGGNTELGHPYLVMELVDGEPIDTYCRSRSASLEQRIELFLQVCDAVQFAHRNLIVHRDLKPSNILVDKDGRVRLLDFGIAKILNATDFSMTVHETRPGSAPMTLAYASPEQIQGQVVTVTTDVYSLGIILYEMLSDTRPYHFDSRDLLAAVSAICKQEITHPSHEIRKAMEELDAGSVAPLVGWRQVKGDLDAIVLKSLAKDPEDRYASVEQLAEDLRRFRDHQPVRARVDTLLYRGRKFIYRHRWGLSAAALIFCILVGSIFALLHQQELLIEQRNLAQQQQLRAQTVSDWMTELFELPDPGRSLGEQVTARELLDKSAQTVQEDLAHDPDLLRQMLTVLGETYGNLGLYSEAEDMVTSALQLVDRGSPAAEVEALSLMIELAGHQADLGRYWEAHALITEAAERVDRLGDFDPTLKVKLLNQQGVLEYRLGNPEEAGPLFRQAEVIARQEGDEENLADILRQHGLMATVQGLHELSEQLLTESLAISRRLHDPMHPDVSQSEIALAANTAAYQGPEQAEKALRRIIERQRKVLGSRHSMLATSLDQLSQVLTDMQRFEEGETASREAIEIGIATLGTSHPLVARFLGNYGYRLLTGGRLEEAEGVYRQALEITEQELGPESFAYGNTLNQLGSIAYRRGQFEEAEKLYHRSFQVMDQAAGPGHFKTVMALSNTATAKTRQGDLAGAGELYAETLERARQAPERPSTYSYLVFNAGLNEKARENNEAAIELFREVSQLDGIDSRFGLEARTHLSHLLLNEERWAEAEPFAREALKGFRAQGRPSAWEESAMRAVAQVDLGLGNYQASIDLHEQLLDRLEDRPSKNAERIEKIEKDLAAAREALAATS